MVSCFQAMQAHPVTPMVRVPWNEPGIIGKVLDGGAMGVICPMINTARARPRPSSPDANTRRTAPAPTARSGSAMYGEASTYQSTANAECLALPMIETREAVANLDAILDVPGVAGAYIGPSDLGLLARAGAPLDREEPEMLAIFERVIEATESAARRPASIAAPPPMRRGPSGWASASSLY